MNFWQKRPHPDIISAPRQRPEVSSARRDDQAAAWPRLDGTDTAIDDSGLVPEGSGSVAYPRRSTSEPMTSHIVSSGGLVAEATELRTRAGNNIWVRSKKPIMALAPMANVTDAAFRQ